MKCQKLVRIFKKFIHQALEGAAGGWRERAVLPEKSELVVVQVGFGDVFDLVRAVGITDEVIDGDIKKIRHVHEHVEVWLRKLVFIFVNGLLAGI